MEMLSYFIILKIVTSFVLTLIIEYITIKIIIQKKTFIQVLLVNMLTNPFSVYIYNLLYDTSLCYLLNVNVFFIVLELLTIIIEGFVYKYLLKINWTKAFVISFIANILSYLIGQNLIFPVLYTMYF